ncbi:Irr1 protein [Martiniozyma asiatica (nom. inval.)]|nr:Irr1 protein [Martiniozyma asiatica]
MPAAQVKRSKRRGRRIVSDASTVISSSGNMSVSSLQEQSSSVQSDPEEIESVEEIEEISDLEEVEEEEEEENDEAEFEEVSRKVRSKPQSRKRRKGNNKKAIIPGNEDDDDEPIIAFNIDDVEDYQENSYFESLSDPYVSTSELAQIWLDEFLNDDLETKFNALKDFLNLLLRCAGCVLQLTRNDVENSDSARDTISDVQDAFQRQKYHEMPLLYPPVGANSKDWKQFPTNVNDFFHKIVELAGERGALYDDEFSNLLLEWIGAMSCSNIRALRYVATFFGLRMQTEVCILIVSVSDLINKSEKQLKEENNQLEKIVNQSSHSKRSAKKVETMGERIKQIEANVQNFRAKKDTLGEIITDFFNTLFFHRYRDVCADIRHDCILHLGEWMTLYPETFFDVVYMRYLGWTMTDSDAIVRTEAFNVLTKLYKRGNTSQALKQFTDFFKTKLIQIAIYETDFNARLHCLQLLGSIIEKKLLDNDEIIQVCGLIFVDDEDVIYQFHGGKTGHIKITKELCKCIAAVEKSACDDLYQESQAALDQLQNEISLDVKSCIKIKTMLSVLDEAYDYYFNHYANNIIKTRIINGRYEKLSKVCQYLYQEKRYNELHNRANEMFETYLNYLTFDLTDVTNSRDILELDESLQVVLLCFVIGASTIYAQGADNQFFRVLFPTHSRRSYEILYDKDHYITKVASQLKHWWEMFHNNMENLTLLTKLCGILKANQVVDQHDHITECSQLLVGMIPSINFELFDRNKPTCKYYDSIGFYLTLLVKHLKPNEDKYRDVVMEIMYKVKETADIKQITRLYILSQNDLAHALIYTDIGETLVNVAHTLVESSTASPSEIHIFFKFFNEYVTYCLGYNYKLALTNGYTDSLSSVKNLKIDEICSILTHMIKPDESNEYLSLDIIQDAATTYIDIILSLNAYDSEMKHIRSSGRETDIFSSQTSTNTIDKDISYTTIDQDIAGRLLKLFCILEFQTAEVIGTQNKLDRDEMEDVNFERFSLNLEVVTEDHIEPATQDEENGENNNLTQLSNILKKDSKKKAMDKLVHERMAELGGKLAMCYSLHVFTSEEVGFTIMKRIKLNCEYLSPLFSTILNKVELLDDDKLKAELYRESRDNHLSENNEINSKNSDNLRVVEDEEELSEEDPLDEQAEDPISEREIGLDEDIVNDPKSIEVDEDMEFSVTEI